MKLQWTGATALASPLAAVAAAHKGAIGVVLDRMNGMTAMKDTVAERVGYAGTASGGPVARSTPDPTKPGIDLKTLAADDLFARISAIRSSCHARYRAGRN